MTKAYINYPVPHIRSYSNTESAQIGKHNKADQRHIRIDIDTLSTELIRFSTGYYRFAAKTSSNDMWLEIDLNDSQFEGDVLRFIQRQIGQRYTPLSPNRIQIEQV
ncbi:MAG: hypothetical protein JWP57_3769 [Spirosoma sp.]|nr:hypothetical protein [Spirosoma sp.]